MHVDMTSFNGNPNVGLYCLATEKYCLIGRDVPESTEKLLKEILEVPVHRITLAGTSLIGVFGVANSNGLVIPAITFDHEVEAIRKLKIPVTVIETKHTALGNNVLANDNIAILNQEFTDKERRIISDALKVDVKAGTIAELDIVGSTATVTPKGCLVHRDISQAELSFLSNNLKVECTPGTVNMGNPYVNSGVVANSKGFIIGEMSGGPEIQNADEAFGFINR